MEQRKIEQENISFQYSLKKYKRSRSLRVRVSQAGEVSVTAPLHIKEDSVISFLKTNFAWITNRITYFKKFTVVPVKGSKRKHYLEYKEEARKIITERLEHFNQFYQFPYKRISIKNTSTRWGSCSTQGNLNFSYKLLFVPIELLEYVVIHELCHLQEMNHGPQFWQLVAKQCPDYKIKRKKLKTFRL